MKLFDELFGDMIEGVESEKDLEVCHSLLLNIYVNSEKGIQVKNNNLELATTLNVSQSEVKKTKKILEVNGFIEVVKEDERESSILLTTKGSFYSAKLRTEQLKEAMTTVSEPQSETFVDYTIDMNFVDLYNRLSYRERVVFEAIVATILCREQYQSCHFRILSSLLDAQAGEIMQILSTLEDKGLVVLVGEKSTKIYLTNSKEFLLTHYADFYNTGFVKNDYVYKAAFHYDEFSGYAAPYQFPDFEVVYTSETDLFEAEETFVESPEVVMESPVAQTTPLNNPMEAGHARVFVIDTVSLSLEHFVQTAAFNTLTDNDYYVAMLSPSSIGGPMSFTLFNHLMKLPCRGETDMVEDLTLYYQFFTIKIMEMVQAYPNSTVVVLTNDPGYPTIAHQLQTKLKLRENQIQVMNYMG